MKRSLTVGPERLPRRNIEESRGSRFLAYVQRRVTKTPTLYGARNGRRCEQPIYG